MVNSDVYNVVNNLITWLFNNRSFYKIYYSVDID